MVLTRFQNKQNQMDVVEKMLKTFAGGVLSGFEQFAKGGSIKSYAEEQLIYFTKMYDSVYIRNQTMLQQQENDKKREIFQNINVTVDTVPPEMLVELEPYEDERTEVNLEEIINSDDQIIFIPLDPSLLEPDVDLPPVDPPGEMDFEGYFKFGKKRIQVEQDIDYLLKLKV